VATHAPLTERHARFPDSTIADAIQDRLVHDVYQPVAKGESRRKTDSLLPMPAA
jgi:hypothetical protein